MNWANCRTFSVEIFGDHIMMSVAGVGSFALNNLIILFMLRIITAYNHPNSLVMVKSFTETIEVTGEEALMMRAFDRIESETSEENKQKDVLQKAASRIFETIKPSTGDSNN